MIYENLPPLTLGKQLTVDGVTITITWDPEEYTEEENDMLIQSAVDKKILEELSKEPESIAWYKKVAGWMREAVEEGASPSHRKA